MTPTPTEAALHARIAELEGALYERVHSDPTANVGGLWPDSQDIAAILRHIAPITGAFDYPVIARYMQKGADEIDELRKRCETAEAAIHSAGANTDSFRRLNTKLIEQTGEQRTALIELTAERDEARRRIAELERANAVAESALRAATACLDDCIAERDGQIFARKHIERQRDEARRLLAERADVARVLEWLNSTKRKPSELAFTNGPERELADAIDAAETFWITELEQAEKARDEARRQLAAFVDWATHPDTDKTKPPEVPAITAEFLAEHDRRFNRNVELSRQLQECREKAQAWDWCEANDQWPALERNRDDVWLWRVMGVSDIPQFESAIAAVQLAMKGATDA